MPEDKNIPHIISKMSFFATDKDLSKVPSRKINHGQSRSRVTAPGAATVPSSKLTVSSTVPSFTSTSSSGSSILPVSSPQNNLSVDGKDDIINIARQEREIRQLAKKQNEFVIKIQAWYRGRRSSKKFYYSLQDSLNSQLQDIAKVRSLLQAKQQLFVVPLNVANNQMTQLLVLLKFGKKRQDTFQNLFNTFCTSVLIPSFETMEIAKNMVITEFQSKNGFRRLRTFFITLLHGIVIHKNDAATLFVYSNTINALLFDKNNLEQNKDISIAKSQFRSEVFGYRLLPEIRSSIIGLSGTVSALAVDEMDDYRSVKEKVSKTLLGVTNAISILFSIAKRMVLVGESEDELRFPLFVKDILTIPFISIMLHDSQTLPLVTEDNILDRLVELLLSSSSNSVFLKPKASNKQNCLLQELQQSVDDNDVSKLQYLIANITSLFNPFVISKISTLPPNRLNEQVQGLSKFLIAFIAKIYISDISNDALKISWKVSGSRMLAMEKPKMFVLQYTVILDRSFLNLLVDRVAASDILYSSLQWQSWAIGKDEADVASALASSSSGLVNKRLQDAHSSWFGSSWAAKLGLSNMGSLLSGSSTASKPKESNGILSWFSSWKSKNSQSAEKDSSSKSQDLVVDHQLFPQVVRLLALVLSPASNTKYTSKSWKAVSALTYSRQILLLLWYQMHQDYKGFEDSCAKFNPEDSKKYTVLPDAFCIVACFLSCLKVYLISLDDIELYDQQKPLPLHQLLPLIRGCNALLFKILKYNAQNSNNGFTPDSLGVVATVVNAAGTANQEVLNQNAMVMDCYTATIKNLQFVLSDFYNRWARRPFCSIETWLISGGNAISLSIGDNSNFSFAILQWMPWSVDFSKRLKFVRDELDRERIAIQGGHDPYGLGGGFRSQGTVIRIRRSQVMNDGMRSLMSLSAEQWRDRIVVRYVNELGADEAGIDVGGLFKDFVTDLSATIFDPSYGLFSQTHDGLLYPNPAAGTIYQNTELEDMFLFIGRVLGKAILENITISPQFTHFFLAFMHGRYNFMNLIDDLATLDPDLFKNLMFLKNCEESMVPDLGLTFSIVDGSFGRNQEIELVPGGSHIEVHARNRHWYVSCVAKYYLHDRIRRQAGAFFRGLHELVNPTLLRIFSPPEVQIMVSGSVCDISLGDWKSHTRYAGGYTGIDPYIQQFWAVVEGFTESEKSLLLRFVTSVPRPPSLGFSALNPPFTIQRVDVDSDARLPTASTCFNILKLPRYSGKSILREKLLLAINSRSGFDLS